MTRAVVVVSSVSRTLLLFALLLIPAAAHAQGRHHMRGMVVAVDTAHRSVVISHDAIADVMPAMTMPFAVRNRRDLKGLVPGAIVTFTLVVGKTEGHIERVQVVRYESVEQDPLTARRLKLLQGLGRETVPVLTVGQKVPDFTLIDQAHARVALSQFAGKVVALNFVYTSCVLPQFCSRLSSYFSTVQKRFADRRDLVFVTVTFDPARDTPERLAEYAGQWNADASRWHFLTGSAADIQHVTAMFGLDAFPDEGLISHSTRTVVIDRGGAVAATIEGNQYTAAQLGDLVDSVLRRPS
jgi:protein SCO1/2